jgi:hypothetical protein
MDGDKDLFDCIEDTILTEWVPGAKIRRFYDPEHLDFSYAVEDTKHGHLLIADLGTEGTALEAGWRDDFSPGIETKEFHELGGHVGFISAGQRVYSAFYDLILKYQKSITIIGHSRGDPKSKAAARAAYRLTGEIPTVIGYCGPPTFTPTAADEYDKIMAGATITVSNQHDITDNIGLPILKHVGIPFRLTYERGQNPLPFVDGHKYSSVFKGLISYCSDRKMSAEVDYLESRKWVATI